MQRTVLIRQELLTVSHIAIQPRFRPAERTTEEERSLFAKPRNPPAIRVRAGEFFASASRFDLFIWSCDVDVMAPEQSSFSTHPANEACTAGSLAGQHG